MEQSNKGPPIGVDLGTSCMRVAVFDGDNFSMIPDHHGNYAMPSYVAFTDSGVLVGEAAKRQALQNPSNTIFDIIRLIGKRYSDPSIQNYMRRWPFKVRGTPDDDKLLVEVRWMSKIQHFTPVEICSMILTQIKQNAKTKLDATTTDAVISVPVYFTYKQRQEVRRAGLIAGLNCLQIISAPSASAMFHSFERLSKSPSMFANIAHNFFPVEPEEHNMIIFDLGAGTLDVSLVTAKANVCKVRATAGDVGLGGSDFDNNLVDHFLSLLEKNGLRDIGNIPDGTIIHLRTLCEKAKIQLSSGNSEVPMKISPFYKNLNLDSFITESKFQMLNKKLFQRCRDVVKKCLRDAGINTNAVDEVILAGGSARIPFLQSCVHFLFEGKDLNMSNHMETATAYGAALQAFSLTNRLYGSTSFLSLQDATPFSLGVASAHGVMNVFVPKNTNIPTKKEQTFHFQNYGENFPVEIYEGERSLTCENDLLGKFEFSPDSSSRNGHTITVSFEIHENGTLTVTAEEISTEIKKRIIIANNNIEESERRVWDTFLYRVGEKSKLGTSIFWERMRATEKLGKLPSTDKDRSEKIMGQSSRQYVEPEEYAIGIDFGTTYSRVAVWQKDRVKIIENEYGSRSTCSAVAFTDTGRLIGDIVHREHVTTSPANTILDIKRLIGRYSSDQSVHNDSKFLPFQVTRGDKNRSTVSVHYKNEKIFAPEEITAMILLKMKEIAEAHLNSKVSKAVISVPSSFNDFQRNAIMDAGAIAGLDVLQLLNETTAAAIAYFLQQVGGQNTGEKTLLVFDFGGGCLDVSIVKIKEGSIRVQAVAGDTNLGGQDFDNNMVSYFVEKFMKEKKKDIRNKPRSLRRLRKVCEKAKRVLSTNTQTVVEVDALEDEINFRSVITRKEFEELNDILFKKSMSCVERCLEDAMIEKSSIDEVVLVGGSTRIPRMQRLLQEFFNGKELCKSINADEAVVYGAAAQAAILSGNEDRKNFNILELQDVSSLSFGLENKDGVGVNLLIPKDTPIPAKKELIFSTCSDHLSIPLIELQEHELVFTTVYNISGMTPNLRGSSKIYLSLYVDNSGILNVRAKEIRGRGENEIVICKKNGCLTTEEIEKMRGAAACYKAEDDELNTRIAALSSLENLACKVIFMASNLRAPASFKISVERVTDKALDWLDKNRDAGLDHINDWKMRLETIKISLEDSVRVDALKSLENLVNKIKAIAKDPGISTTSKKSMEKVVDDAIACLETSCDAAIDEINAWNAKLEIIGNQIVYLGTSADC